MTSTDTNIVDSNLGLVASSELELVLVGCYSKQMNVSGSVFVKRHGFKQDIVCTTSLDYFLSQVNDLEDSALDLKGVWIHVFADLAFKSLPVE